jgi:tetracycline resistance efflux pump
MARLENNIEQLHHRQQENASTQTLTRKESIAGFLIPLACFFLFLPLFLLYLGNSSLFGGPHSILEALKSTNIMASFCYTSGIASLILALFLLQQKKEKPLHLVKLIFTSAWSMKNSFKILTLAFTLGAIISQDLHAGSYIAKLICCNLSSFLLPLIVFILATASTASTGSSWGTIAIITPLALQTLAVLSQQALPIGLEHIPLLYQTIGAILSGAVAGAHLSPLTEATIISATAAQANHLLHVKTQVQYALPAFFVTSLLFLATGLAPVLAQSSLYMWGLVGIGIFATIRLIAILGKQTQK